MGGFEWEFCGMLDGNDRMGLRDDGKELCKKQPKHHFYHPKIPIFYLIDELMVFKTEVSSR